MMYLLYTLGFRQCFAILEWMGVGYLSFSKQCLEYFIWVTYVASSDCIAGCGAIQKGLD